jgi:uncharacterized protein (UPF0332 family)
MKQRKGIRIIEPNPNLTKEYLRKAISALNTMNAALQIKESDWTLTTAYYARYFALYALLMKLGIKSEIHDCSIAIARLLAKNKILSQNLVIDITKAKQTRIDTQYYITTEIKQGEIIKNVDSARKFVLEIQKSIEEVTAEQINHIRNTLKNIRTINTKKGQ